MSFTDYSGASEGAARTEVRSGRAVDRTSHSIGVTPHGDPDAKSFTVALGGRWFGAYGVAPCPVCQPERRRGLFANRAFQSLAHYGPVLAGGRLITVSSDGAMRQFSPQDGSLLATSAMPGGAATNPVVAGGTLYVVSKDGQLLAFR